MGVFSILDEESKFPRVSKIYSKVNMALVAFLFLFSFFFTAKSLHFLLFCGVYRISSCLSTYFINVLN